MIFSKYYKEQWVIQVKRLRAMTGRRRWWIHCNNHLQVARLRMGIRKWLTCHWTVFVTTTKIKSIVNKWWLITLIIQRILWMKAYETCQLNRNFCSEYSYISLSTFSKFYYAHIQFIKHSNSNLLLPFVNIFTLVIPILAYFTRIKNIS